MGLSGHRDGINNFVLSCTFQLRKSQLLDIKYVKRLL